MKIPEVVKAGGIPYEVVFTGEPSETDHEADGIVVFDKQVIRLKSNMAPEYTEAVFIHELIHIITKHAAVDLGSNSETITEAMAHVLHQILNDNEF
jgi:Zn-dependent protease with chaperone function